MVDWNEKRMIVLSCGHAYTMETMDMHMKMKDYYEGSIEGEWTSIKILSTLSTNTKTCPTCRIPIKKIRRYGRIINKCSLDTQNKNFQTKYDDQLNQITKQIISLEKKMNKMDHKDKLRKGIKKLSKVDSRPVEMVFKDGNILDDKSHRIIPYQYFINVKKHHGFEKISRKVWLDHVGELLKCYQKLTFILCNTKTPPYKKAFEASISSL